MNVRTEPSPTAPVACPPLPIGGVLVEIQRQAATSGQPPSQFWIRHALGWTLNAGPAFLRDLNIADELQAQLADRTVKDSELIAKMDADGDGAVSGTEVEKHVREMEEAKAADKARIVELVAEVAELKSKVGTAEGQLAKAAEDAEAEAKEAARRTQELQKATTRLQALETAWADLQMADAAAAESAAEEAVELEKAQTSLVQQQKRAQKCEQRAREAEATVLDLKAELQEHERNAPVAGEAEAEKLKVELVKANKQIERLKIKYKE
jgi:chromosome segregation ATPase